MTAPQRMTPMGPHREDTTHRCPADGCQRRVPRHRLACPGHWALVSIPTQRAVYAAYRTGDAVWHATAMQKAIEEMNR